MVFLMNGIPDEVMDVVLGALTHEDNRAVLTSQPTRNAGLFYETHHKLSHRAGGIWIALTFNGEESPLVSKRSLEEQRQKYGSRDDPQYQIRVLGQFPDRADEFLITKRQAEEMYVGASIFEEHVFGYVITVDVGGGVGREDSVIAVSKVWGEAQWGDRARRVEVVDVPLCKNKDDITELFGKINECILKYPNATLVVDDNGAGKGLGQLLKKHVSKVLLVSATLTMELLDKLPLSLDHIYQFTQVKPVQRQIFLQQYAQQHDLNCVNFIINRVNFMKSTDSEKIIFVRINDKR